MKRKGTLELKQVIGKEKEQRFAAYCTSTVRQSLVTAEIVYLLNEVA